MHARTHGQPRPPACTHVSIDMHKRTHARTHACMRARVPGHARTHARTHACTHVCMDMHARTHARTHACMRRCRRAWTRTHACTHVCVDMHARTHARMHARTYAWTCTCARTHTCKHACMHAGMHGHVRMHANGQSVAACAARMQAMVSAAGIEPALARMRPKIWPLRHESLTSHRTIQSWLPSLPPPTFFNTNYGMQCTTMNHETLGIPEKPKKPKAYLSNLLKNRGFS